MRMFHGIENAHLITASVGFFDDDPLYFACQIRTGTVMEHKRILALLAF